jgi:hypothetical protein
LSLWMGHNACAKKLLKYGADVKLALKEVEYRTSSRRTNLEVEELVALVQNQEAWGPWVSLQSVKLWKILEIVLLLAAGMFLLFLAIRLLIGGIRILVRGLRYYFGTFLYYIWAVRYGLLCLVFLIACGLMISIFR